MTQFFNELFRKNFFHKIYIYKQKKIAVKLEQREKCFFAVVIFNYMDLVFNWLDKSLVVILEFKEPQDYIIENF